MEQQLKRNKIIRQVCKFSLRKLGQQGSKRYMLSKSIAAVEEANELAEKLGYPKDCYRYEIFDLDYGVDSPMFTQMIENFDELLYMMQQYDMVGVYTYVIDGEYDKGGKKIDSFDKKNS